MIAIGLCPELMQTGALVMVGKQLLMIARSSSANKEALLIGGIK